MILLGGTDGDAVLGNDRARANVEGMNITGDQLPLVNADSARQVALRVLPGGTSSVIC